MIRRAAIQKSFAIIAARRVAMAAFVGQRFRSHVDEFGPPLPAGEDKTLLPNEKKGFSPNVVA